MAIEDRVSIESPQQPDDNNESLLSKTWFRATAGATAVALALTVGVSISRSGGESSEGLVETTVPATAPQNPGGEKETTTTTELTPQRSPLYSSEQYRTDDVLVVNKSNDSINWDSVFRDGAVLEDEYNPVSILQYHATEKLAAICTGDSERLKRQYMIESPSPEDELSRALILIDEYREYTGETLYDPYTSGCFDVLGFSYDTRNISDSVWSDDFSTVEFTVPAFNPSNGEYFDIRHVFTKDETGSYVADVLDYEG